MTKDFSHVVRRDCAHHHAPPRQHPDKPFLLQLYDCLVHRCATYPELGGNFLFGSLVARREDVIADSLF